MSLMERCPLFGVSFIRGSTVLVKQVEKYFYETKRDVDHEKGRKQEVIYPISKSKFNIKVWSISNVQRYRDWVYNLLLAIISHPYFSFSTCGKNQLYIGTAFTWRVITFYSSTDASTFSGDNINVLHECINFQQ